MWDRRDGHLNDAPMVQIERNGLHATAGRVSLVFDS